eukprot:3863325-Pleurochrysis_carterae.AAC.3
METIASLPELPAIALVWKSSSSTNAAAAATSLLNAARIVPPRLSCPPAPSARDTEGDEGQGV